jgi:hypothetical protein
MRSKDDPLAAALNVLPVPVLSRAICDRTRRLAQANLVPLPVADSMHLRHRLPAQAMSAVLLSADAVFAADACLKMGKIFGG